MWAANAHTNIVTSVSHIGTESESTNTSCYFAFAAAMFIGQNSRKGGHMSSGSQ